MKYTVQVILSIVIAVLCIIVAIYTNSHTARAGYEQLYLLPLVYIITFLFLLLPLLLHRFNLFIMSFTIISFLRYVILPFMLVSAQWYVGRSAVDPMVISFERAIYIMLWELIVCTIVIALFFVRKPQIQTIQQQNIIQLPQQRTIYMFFLFLTLFVVIVVPQSLNSFSFLAPHDQMIDIGAGGSIVSIAQYILITAKAILFLLFLTSTYKRYVATAERRWIMLSFLIVLLNICILYGDNRSDFLISAIASLYLFYRLFLKRAVPYLFVALIILVVGLINITVYRNTLSVTGGQNIKLDIADLLQVYLGGPYNVALALELPYYFPYTATFSNFIYDLCRPIIGLNLFFKNLEGYEFTNYLYNYRIYFNEHVAQIIPMIGQGHFYTGFFFAPGLNLLFITIAFIIYRYMLKKNRIELIFFLAIPLTRLGFMMGQNAGILLNDISFVLLLNLTIYWLNEKIVLKRKEG